MTISTKFAARGTATAAAIAAGQQVLNGLTTKKILRTSLLVSALGWASLASAQGISGIGAFVPNTEMGFAPVAAAGEPRIKWINGEYQETNKDLSVKVLGGTLDIARSWSQGRWWLNPAWAPLNFELDPLGTDVKVIERVGVIYERSGQSDLYMAKSKGNAPVYIKKLLDAAKQHTGWQWYDRFGNTISYDKDGRILNYANPSGVKVSFAYDSATSARILDHFDKTIYTVTMANGLITKVDDLAGRSVSYQWTGTQLTQVTDVMGNPWKYEYDSNGQITSRTDPIGFKITAQYSQSIKAPVPMLALGKKGTTIDPTGTSGTTQKLINIWGGGRVGKFDGQSGCSATGATNYLREQRVFEITNTDCRGNSTVVTYDLQGNLLNRTFNGKKTTANQWDGAYSQKYTNARGYNTTTTYDTNYQPLQITHPDGSVEKYTYEPVFGRTSSYANQLGVVSTWSYDDKGNVTEWVEAKGLPEQRTTVYTYDRYSQRIKQAISKSGNEKDPESIITTYAYDTSGNLEVVIDAQGNLTKTSYDLIGNPKNQTDPLNRVTTYLYNTRSQLTGITSPLGFTTQFEYDQRGLKIKNTDPLEQYFNTTYDIYGRVKTKIDQEGSVTTFDYNQYGDLIKTTSAEGVESKTSYDNEGRIETQTDANGNVIAYTYGEKGSENSDLLIKVSYPGNLQNIYKYDEMGRQTLSIQKSGRGSNINQELEVNTTYDAIGRVVATTSSANKTTQTEYDARNRIIKAIDANNYSTQYTYDIQDKQLTVTDSNKNVHRFLYDKLSRLIEETRPEGGSTTFQYDQAGQLVKRTSPDGNNIVIEYDANGRKIRETKISSVNSARKSELSHVISYSYDNAGRQTGYEQRNGNGQLISKVIYTVDKLGRNQQEKITYGDGENQLTVALAQKWNKDGQKISQSYPDSTTSTFTYANGFLKKASQPGMVDDIKWQAYDWIFPAEINYPGVKRINTYDGFYRYENIDANSTVGELKNVLKLGYKYDRDSNVIQIKKWVGQEIQGQVDYGYDDLGRLVKAGPSESLKVLGLPEEQYTYDSVHNRKSSAHQSGEWKYDVGNRLVQSVNQEGHINYDYNHAGNIIEETQSQLNNVRHYEYDAAERVVQIKDNHQTIVMYQYDPQNRRISKTVGQAPLQETTYFFYGEEGLLAEIKKTGNTQEQTKSYGWEPNSHWGTKLLWQADHIQASNLRAYHYLHNDHLGTPQIATNRTGEETWSMLSESFGKASTSVTAVTVINARFPGQYFDKETNTNYNFYRDYNQVTGRYMQSDSIGLSGGVNFYTYSIGNPIGNYDNRGTSAVCVANPQACGQFVVTGVQVAWAGCVAVVGAVSIWVAKAGSKSEDARQAQYEEYKKVCDQPNPFKGDKCPEASFDLGKAQSCYNLRKAWDKKWGKDHNEKIYIDLLRTIREAIATLSKWPCCADCI